IAAVLMVPVTDEKAFLTMLDNLGFKAEKDATDLYSVKQNVLPVDVFFRFANKYAYVTALNAEAVDAKTLVAPGDVFKKELRGFLSATLRVDQIPDGVKQMILQGLGEKLDGAVQEKQAGETNAQQLFRVALVREVGKHLAAAFRDGKELSFDLDV